MMVTIGRMAEKYGRLPHQVEQDATTYDIMISDVLATMDRYESQKKTGKPMSPDVYKYNQDELSAMMEKAKNVKH